MWIPDEPTASPRATAPMALRYEDVSQDGRLMLEAMPHALGETIWRRLLSNHPLAAAMRSQGVVPILSRVVAVGGDGPISVSGAVESEGTYELAHTASADGRVDRIVLVMWCRVRGVVGRTHGPPPDDAGRALDLGRVFAEHVFTRPFADPAQRKVLAIDVDGVPAVPPALYTWKPPAEILVLPEGARAIDAELALDPAPIAFGIDHTDSNQHVNSLVYPRVFLEAALRRLHKHSRAPLMARKVEIAYRKPSFAGEALRVAIRTFAHGKEYGAVGVLLSDEEAKAGIASARPRCFVRLSLGE